MDLLRVKVRIRVGGRGRVIGRARDRIRVWARGRVGGPLTASFISSMRATMNCASIGW